jgi:site-specific recombinase XerD
MMTNLAQYLSAFLREYLPCERRASSNTCETYAYTFQLLVCFAADRVKLPPSKLTIEQLDVTLIVDFLYYLEKERGNSPRTRNARSAAIKAFFRFLEYRVVSCLDQSRRIHAIPMKKIDEKLITHLTHQEMQSLLDVPDPHTPSGIRDRAMLHLCFAAGLRVSELIGLHLSQLELHPQPTIHVMGKGRRERVLPLWKETATVIKAWIALRPNATTVPELFLNARGQAMTRSGFEYILSKHVKIAALKQPSLAKKKISPHSLRHACAISTLKATHDIRKVSLWLGHADLKSTEIYLRADPSEKLETLMAGVPPNLRRGKFRAPDKLLAMLKAKD